MSYSPVLHPIPFKNVNKHTYWQNFYCRESKFLVESLYCDDFAYHPLLNFDVPSKRTKLLPEEYELSHRFFAKALKIISP